MTVLTAIVFLLRLLPTTSKQPTAHAQVIIINNGAQHLNHQDSAANTAHMG